MKVDRQKKSDFSQAELETLARRCELRWDEPMGLFRRPLLRRQDEAKPRLDEAEWLAINKALHDLVRSTEQRLRVLYESISDDAKARELCARMTVSGPQR